MAQAKGYSYKDLISKVVESVISRKKDGSKE